MNDTSESFELLAILLVSHGDSVEVVLKPFLVFVNPVSGSGNARRLVLEHVLKVWNEANVKSRIVLTGEWYLCFG